MKGTFNRVLGGFLAFAAVGAALGFLMELISMTRSTGFEYTLLGVAAATLIYWFVLKGPLGTAIGSLLEGGAVADPNSAFRLEELEDRVQELSLESQRMLELEERLEFTERLLARKAEEAP